MLSSNLSSIATRLDYSTSNLSVSVPSELHQRLLRFPLGEDDALLPLAQITETFRVSIAEILPIPEMPSCVLGICDWRGEMLWLIDFNDLVGHPTQLQFEQELMSLIVIVVQTNHRAIGLGVPQVNDIELHNLQHLQPVAPGLFPPPLLPFVKGTLPGVKGAVLDATAIAQHPLWQHDREII